MTVKSVRAEYSPREKHVRICRCARALAQGARSADLKRIYTEREIQEARAVTGFRRGEIQMSRRRDSVKARRICFGAHRFEDENGRIRLRCHLNGCIIDPIREEWRADHIRRFADDGEDTAENLWPICKRCDVKDKAPNDTKEVAKGKRVAERLYGIRRSKGFPKPKGAKFDWSVGRYRRIEEREP